MQKYIDNRKKMINYFKNLYTKTAAIYLTGEICLKAVLKSFKGPIGREWIQTTITNWLFRLFKLLHLQVTVHTDPSYKIEPGKPYIIMCNHSSLLDIPISYYAFPNQPIRMLAKKELARIPIMGSAMKKAEFPFINRHNREQAIKDLAYAKKLMEKGIILWMAPEGTRSSSGKLQAFKKGGFITAIEANATIIPLAIDGAHKILSKGSGKLNLGQKVDVYICKPIDASQYSLENKEGLIESVHQAIGKNLSNRHYSLDEKAI